MEQLDLKAIRAEYDDLTFQLPRRLPQAVAQTMWKHFLPLLSLCERLSHKPKDAEADRVIALFDGADNFGYYRPTERMRRAIELFLDTRMKEKS